METKAISRNYSFDWLRIIMLLSVFIFHSLRFFNLDGWHIKNATTSWSAEVLVQSLAVWMMPLGFLISGAAVYYALGKGGAGKFVVDKVLRLLVPLVVGMFTHSAYQVYLERQTHGQFSGSFWEFYPHYFKGMYGLEGGNFGWMGIHLWYLEMLFVFCLVFLPLLLWLRRGGGQRLLAKLGSLLAAPGAAILLAIPVVLVINLVDEDSPWGWDVFGGWGILSHAWFFLSGFVIASSDRLLHSIRRLRWVWLAGAVGMIAWQVITWAIRSHALAGFPSYEFDVESADLMAYLSLFALLGFGMQYLNASAPALPRLNEAVLPFYILHQPVLLSVGYFVLRWQIPGLLKWLVIAVISFVLVTGLYELVVRRINLLRFLFGMKLLAKTSPSVATEAALAGGEVR
jgi:peptidoglycan/LPS O-acetylase OafA/YrhL